MPTDAPTPTNLAEPLIGFMCKIDFDIERLTPMEGNRVFGGLADLRREHPCADECGIVEVEIRLRRVIVEGIVL